MSKLSPEAVKAELARLAAEHQAALAPIDAQMYELANQKGQEISRHIKELEALRSMCPHKDNGGMFFFRCEYCDLTDY